MKKNIALTLGILVAIVFSVIALTFWRYMPHVMSKQTLQEQGVFLFPSPRSVPAFEFTDQLGKPFTNEQLNGKWSILFFGFTSCDDVCPTTMHELNKLATKVVEKHFQQRVQYILVSVDPERDSQEKLAQYVTSFNKNFIGLRADLPKVNALASNLNVIVDAPESDEPAVHDDHDHESSPPKKIDHGAQLVIINPAGQYQGFIQSGMTAAQIEPLMASIFATY